MTARQLCNVVYALHAPPYGSDARGEFDAALDGPVGREARAEAALVQHLAAG